jgi:hypothetical protein
MRGCFCAPGLPNEAALSSGAPSPGLMLRGPRRRRAAASPARAPRPAPVGGWMTCLEPTTTRARGSVWRFGPAADGNTHLWDSKGVHSVRKAPQRHRARGPPRLRLLYTCPWPLSPPISARGTRPAAILAPGSAVFPVLTARCDAPDPRGLRPGRGALRVGAGTDRRGRPNWICKALPHASTARGDPSPPPALGRGRRETQRCSRSQSPSGPCQARSPQHRERLAPPPSLPHARAIGALALARGGGSPWAGRQHTQFLPPIAVQATPKHTSLDAPSDIFKFTRQQARTLSAGLQCTQSWGTDGPWKTGDPSCAIAHKVRRNNTPAAETHEARAARLLATSRGCSP